MPDVDVVVDVDEDGDGVVREDESVVVVCSESDSASPRLSLRVRTRTRPRRVLATALFKSLKLLCISKMTLHQRSFVANWLHLRFAPDISSWVLFRSVS